MIYRFSLLDLMDFCKRFNELELTSTLRTKKNTIYHLKSHFTEFPYLESDAPAGPPAPCDNTRLALIRSKVSVLRQEGNAYRPDFIVKDWEDVGLGHGISSS